MFFDAAAHCQCIDQQSHRLLCISQDLSTFTLIIPFPSMQSFIFNVIEDFELNCEVP